MYEDTVDTVVGKKTCMVIHENPNEGIIDLDLSGDGDTPGLGVYHLRYTSEIVSMSSAVSIRELTAPTVDDLCSIQLQTQHTKPFAFDNNLRVCSLA